MSMFPVEDFQTLPFEEVYARLTATSAVRLYSTQNASDEQLTHQIVFTDPLGNICTVEGDDLQAVAQACLARVALLQSVGKA